MTDAFTVQDVTVLKTQDPLAQYTSATQSPCWVFVNYRLCARTQPLQNFCSWTISLTPRVIKISSWHLGVCGLTILHWLDMAMEKAWNSLKRPWNTTWKPFVSGRLRFGPGSLWQDHSAVDSESCRCAGSQVSSTEVIGPFAKVLQHVLFGHLKFSIKKGISHFHASKRWCSDDVPMWKAHGFSMDFPWISPHHPWAKHPAPTDRERYFLDSLEAFLANSWDSVPRIWTT